MDPLTLESSSPGAEAVVSRRWSSGVRRRTVLHGLAAVATSVRSAESTRTAEPYPVRPIRLVVPYGAGGVADITARIVTQRMSANLGQPIVVLNRPGAGAIAAAQTVANAEPDGYTLLLIGNSTALSPSLYKSLPFDVIRDFVYVASFSFFELALVVDRDSRFRSVRELIDHARADPGRLNIGTINTGTTQNLAALLFNSRADIRTETIPYRSSAEVMAALRSGDVAAAFEVISPLVGQIKAGSVRVLGVASERRSVVVPDSPTIAATVPGFAATSWDGIAAPAATPHAIVDRLHLAAAQAIADPGVRQQLVDIGVLPAALTPKETLAQLEQDIRKWKTVIEQAGIEKQ